MIHKILLFCTLIFFSFIIHAQQTYHSYVIDEYASCAVYGIADNAGNAINLPQDVGKYLDCPPVISIYNSLLCYLNYDSLAIQIFDIENSNTHTLFTVYPDIDGISNPAWSPCGTKLCFVIINQQQLYGYTSICRLIVVTLNENYEVMNKQKFDRPVNFICGSICSSLSGDDFKFIDNNTIQYRRNINISERPGEYDLIRLNTEK